MSILNFLYSGTQKTLDEPEYDPPLKFEHAQPALVANFPKSPLDGDGQNVKVYEERWPASFFIIRADAFSLSTGSGDEAGKLAFAIARAVARGMLGISQCDPE